MKNKIFLILILKQNNSYIKNFINYLSFVNDNFKIIKINLKL